jgi:hypothetical protein
MSLTAEVQAARRRRIDEEAFITLLLDHVNDAPTPEIGRALRKVTPIALAVRFAHGVDGRLVTDLEAALDEEKAAKSSREIWAAESRVENLLHQIITDGRYS